VVTLGAAGSLVVGRDGVCATAPPFPVVAVDSTAAGDAFVGAFALARGLAPDQPLRWVNAAGAPAITHAGAQPLLPTRADVEAFLQNHPSGPP
jgi:ribokinase